MLRAVNAKQERVVFILWGTSARRKRALIDTTRHVVIEAHPSPLSAANGFFGSRPFSWANAARRGRPRTHRLADSRRVAVWGEASLAGYPGSFATRPHRLAA